MAYHYNSIKEFTEAISPEEIFRFLVYRKMFTPYEQEQKFLDETQFEDSYYRHARIGSITTLPNSDILIEFQMCDENGRTSEHIEFHKLSEIQLSCWRCDNE